MMRFAIAVVATLLSMSSHSACYTVRNASGTVVYQSLEPPVDLSKPLGDTIPQRFGERAGLVLSLDESNCPVIDLAEPVPFKAGQAADTALRVYETNTPQEQAPIYTNSSAANTPTGMGGSLSYSGSRATAGPIHTGPRGGQYTITSSSNKNYVRRT